MPRESSQADQFDYVIIGGGSAGCILANRLSADPNCRVLLLEAGKEDRSIWTKVPFGYAYTVGNPKFDWCFQTAPEPELNNRQIVHPRGKVLGGSSVINGLFQVRGQAGDFDHWRQLGLEGWDWDSVLPYFIMHEDYAGGASPVHGVGGELHVEPQRNWWPVLHIIKDAAKQAGYKECADFNAGDNEGVGEYQAITGKGLRQSTSRVFLKPVRSRSNLRVETQALAQRILFEGKRAVGVSYRQGGELKTANAAREVIVSTGAIKTPQLLQVSGVGPAALLSQHGIKVVLDKPGVGENLQDHLQAVMTYKLENTRSLNETYNSLLGKMSIFMLYVLWRSGPMGSGASPLGLFVKSDDNHDRANLGFIIIPYTRQSKGLNIDLHNHPGLTMSFYDCRPTSRGTIKLTGSEMADAPEMRFNYLATEHDRRVAIDGMKITRAIMRQPAVAPFKPFEMKPGLSTGDDDQSLLDAFREISTTIFHPVGTAKMGLPSDPMTVVDGRLKVIGIEGLRVVDASVMPTVTSGNTNAPTMMIAEKAAEMIIQDARAAKAM